MLDLFFARKDDIRLISDSAYSAFSPLHIIVTALVFIFVFRLIRSCSHKKPGARLLWTYWAYAVLVVLNIARFIWDLHVGFDVKEDLPLQLCGIQMFAIPVALFSRGKAGDYMREFVFSYGTLGFFLALLMPFGTEQEYPLLHFRTIQSILYHADLGFVSLMLPGLNYRPRIKHIRKAYLVLLIAVFITGIVNILSGGNYLYTAYLPIRFDPLPWPLYLPFLAAFIFLAGRLPYYGYNALQRLYNRDAQLGATKAAGNGNRGKM